MRTKTKREAAPRGIKGKDTIVEDDMSQSKTPLRSLFRREKHSPMSRAKGSVADTSPARSSPASVVVDINMAARKETVCNYDVNPPLLYKLIEYAAWDEVIERIAHAPTEAATWVARYSPATDEVSLKCRSITWKMLPLHLSVLFRAPITVVQAIYNSFPEAISLPDEPRKMLPVHVAARVRIDTVIMQFLIHAYPSALNMVDYKGRSPMDIVHMDLLETDDEASRALVDLIESNMNPHCINFEGIESTRSGVLQADIEVDYDKNPTALIRYIESKNWNDAIVRCQRFPREAASWLCRYQKHAENNTMELRWKILPIHSAVVLNAPKSVIEALIDAFPDGLRMGDDRNMLSIHMAFRLGVDLDVCALLIQSYPQSLQHKDNKGNTPMQILKAYRKKYLTAQFKGKQNFTAIDLRRKVLIDHYLESRYYRGDSIKDEIGIKSYDSDYDSYTVDTDSCRDDDSYSSFSDTDGNKLFYNGMLMDFVHLTLKGFLNAPRIMCACDAKDLEEPKDILRCGQNQSYRPT